MHVYDVLKRKICFKNYNMILRLNQNFEAVNHTSARILHPFVLFDLKNGHLTSIIFCHLLHMFMDSANPKSLLKLIYARHSIPLNRTQIHPKFRYVYPMFEQWLLLL